VEVTDAYKPAGLLRHGSNHLSKKSFTVQTRGGVIITALGREKERKKVLFKLKNRVRFMKQ
jgi:hypothetical protein